MNAVCEGMGREIVITDAGQHGRIPQCFSKHFTSLVVYIKLNSLGISISSESKSISDLRLFSPSAILTPALSTAHSPRPLVPLFVGQGDFYFFKIMFFHLLCFYAFCLQLGVHI